MKRKKGEMKRREEKRERGSRGGRDIGRDGETGRGMERIERKR